MSFEDAILENVNVCGIGNEDQDGAKMVPFGWMYP